MKLSAYKEPGFKEGRGYQVTMDGRPLQRVFKVDTCTGVAWVADTDKEGNVLVDRQKHEVKVRKVYGPMRVEPINA